MLKFFRNIRHNLLSKGKTAKYLKYALGEIVLVVIGILIALSINTWNEERKEKMLILEILKEIKEDLAADTTEFNNGIETYEFAIKIKKWGLDRTEYSIDQKDSILMYLFPTSFDYKIVNKGFEKLKNSGLHNHFQFNDEINFINEYYTVEMNAYDRIIEWDLKENERFTDWSQNRNIEYELHFYDFPSVHNESDNFSYLLSEIKSAPFRTMMEFRYHRRIVIVDLIKDMKNKSVQLIDKIANSIE